MEPYRVFFPLGMLAAIWGVMMWPLVYAGKLGFYPAEAHTRIMIGGFIGAHILGFLGTAFPRLVSSKPWSRMELFSMLTLWISYVLLNSFDQVRIADGVFVVMMLWLIFGLWRRWFVGGCDTPPPGFVLAVMGVLGALVSTIFLVIQPAPSYEALKWARLFMFQGFTLLPLMGIGPYLFPRFFGKPSTHAFDESPGPPAGWWPRAILALVAGIAMITTFAMEVNGVGTIAHVARALIVLVWFVWEVPGMLSLRTGTIARGVQFAFAGLVLGFVATAIWPEARLGTIHLFFASGVGLATVIAATRVILGHAGRHELIEGKRVWMRWVLGLLLLAALTRASSDLFPAVRVSHHIYAAWAWAAGSAVWLIVMVRHVFEGEEEKKSACPRKR